MHRKLTLRLDHELVEKAKRHARETGQSVSSLVASFFAALDVADASGRQVEITPRVRSLRGVLAGAQADEQDYRRHLEKKHQ